MILVFALLISLGVLGYLWYRKSGALEVTFSQTFVKAFSSENNAVFAETYVRMGDKDPTGQYRFTTKGGGKAPDERWNSVVQKIFQEKLQKVKSLGVTPSTMQWEGIEGVEISGQKLEDRRLEKLIIRVNSNVPNLRISISRAMLVARGWVLTEDSLVEFSK